MAGPAWRASPWLIVVLAGETALAGCSAFGVPLGSCPSLPRTAPANQVVSVRYLGVGGFLFRFGDDVILTAPLYTNPSVLEVAAGHSIRADTASIDRLLPADASEAKGILVGHSHYDHLLDVPHVAAARATRATIYGSETTVRLLASRPELGVGSAAPRVVALDGLAGDDSVPGRWVTLSPGLRFMALRSEHSAQFTLKLLGAPMPVHLWRGAQEAPLVDALPRSAADWPEGSVFSYVIDFTDAAGAPVFRIYYQDSGTNEPVGYPPRSLLAERGVDLAILCVGGDFERLCRHPEGILERTRPRFVLLSHWEDFFVSQEAYEFDRRVYEIPPASERKTAKFLARVRRAAPPDATVWLPCPSRSAFEIPVEARPARR